MNTTSNRTEPYIVQKTDEGYRVCSALNPAQQFVVQDTGDDMTCTCPEFAANSGDPDWCCNHIKAVHQFMDGQNHRRPPDTGAAGEAQPAPTPPTPPPPKPKKPGPKGAASDASMVIKRSLSPDGRIDSLSVEFSVPVNQLTSEEIKQNAERAMKLQAEIMQGFASKPNGNGAAQSNGMPHRNSGNGRHPQTGRHGIGSGVNARLLNIDAMDTRRGRSLFINVFVENQMAKLFGDQSRLGEALAEAGYADRAEDIAEGVELNLPCRAVTKRNGKYLNIERLLPAGNGG